MWFVAFCVAVLVLLLLAVAGIVELQRQHVRIAEALAKQREYLERLVGRS